MTKEQIYKIIEDAYTDYRYAKEEEGKLVGPEMAVWERIADKIEFILGEEEQKLAGLSKDGEWEGSKDYAEWQKSKQH